jgi:rubrerythrin
VDTKTRMGMNRTGNQTSPTRARRMVDEAARTAPPHDGERLSGTREGYIAESEPVGTVPLPGTVKGAASTALEKLTGKRPEVLIDKLGERLAFERSGTRLYDALLAKFRAAPEGLPGVSQEQLRRFRDEEASHFNLVADALDRLGADPTAQTPSADVTGVSSLGLLQAIDDPRTTLPQALQVLLMAELIDNDGWEFLIELTQELGQDELAEDFRRALEEERVHLSEVRRWAQEAVLGEAT